MNVATSNGCTWWDTVDLYRHCLSGLYCPHCGSEALLYGSEEEWWDSVRRYADINPGYERLVTFARGRCFDGYDVIEQVCERLHHPTNQPQPQRGAS